MFDPIGTWHHPAGLSASERIEYPHDYVFTCTFYTEGHDPADPPNGLAWRFELSPCPPDCTAPCSEKEHVQAMFFWVPGTQVLMQTNVPCGYHDMVKPGDPGFDPDRWADYVDEARPVIYELERDTAECATECIVQCLTEAGYVHFSGKELTA